MTHESNCMQIQQINGRSLYLFIKALIIIINVFTSFQESNFPINIFHLFGRGRPFLPLKHVDKVFNIMHMGMSHFSGLELFRGQSALQVSAITMVTSPSPAGERSPFLPTDSLTPAFLWLLSAKVQHSTKQTPRQHSPSRTLQSIRKLWSQVGVVTRNGF